MEFTTTMIQRQHKFEHNGIQYTLEIEHHGTGSHFSVWLWQNDEILQDRVGINTLREAKEAAAELKQWVLDGLLY